MNLPVKPIYLFADSQLLFWTGKGGLFLQSIKEQIRGPSPKAAYVGASNGDDPQYYSIFEAAMGTVDIQDRRMILSSFSPADESFVQEADIILLAGGDVANGWKVFTDSGLKELIAKRYYEGSLLIGVSAGAVQLGLFGLVETKGSSNELINTFQLVPFMICTHEEKDEWSSLRNTIQLLSDTTKGIGISTGGGMIYYPDESIEAIRYPLAEFSTRSGGISHSLITPRQD